ncbi:MAG: hypothetical protein CIT03_05840 [Methanobacterium sp.]|nr:MAG: hypothetical protein CIT03_05840 [Methanobacterium sp.]
MEGKNVLLGILAIILGFLVICFPLISVFAASVLAGIGILFLGIWLLGQSFKSWHINKISSAAYLILGIIGIIVGIGLFGNILAFSILASFWLYIIGFLIFISGIITLFEAENNAGKGLGGLGIILGILYIILGSFAWDPYYLAALIAIWLIISGIMEFFAPE